MPAQHPALPTPAARGHVDGLLVSAADVAKRLGIPRATVRQWLWSGKLPASRAGGRDAGWRIRESDLEAFIAARRNVPNREQEG